MPTEAEILDELIASGDFQSREAKIARELERARARQMTPSPEGLKVGPWFIAASPMSHSATVMERIAGRQSEADLRNQESELANQRARARQNLFQASQDQSGTPDLYSIMMSDEPTAAEQARALQQAISSRRRAGIAAELTGDPAMAKVGAGLVAGAGDTESGLLGIGKARLELGLAGRKLEAASEKEKYDRAFRAAQQANQEAYRRQMLGLQGAQLDLARQRLSQQKELALKPGSKHEGIQDRWTWNQVEKLGKTIDPAGTLAGSLNDLDILASELKSGKTIDVPGIGPIEGYKPDILTSPEGIRMRQAAIRTIQGIVYGLSGKQVTEKEFELFLKGYGLSPNATAAQFQEGVMAFLANQAANTKLKEARFSPEVKRLYTEQGGITGQDLIDRAAKHGVNLDRAIRVQPSGQPSEPLATGKSQKKATHRFNPATGQIEAIE